MQIVNKTSPLVRRNAGCERGIEGCVLLTGKVKDQNTYACFPWEIPANQTFQNPNDDA